MLNLIEGVLDKFLLPNSHFQDYINHRFDSENFELIDKQFLHNTFCEYEGLQFEVSDQLFSINEVLDDYNFSDIRETDIVLDIGANIGAFTMMAAKRAKHVYAVEPIYSDILLRNIEKNKFKNVTVLNTGIGTGTQNLTYHNNSKKVQLTTFTDIIRRCGTVDFMKCDCEGCEHSFTVDDLRGIRRIEIEVHNFNKMPSLISFKKKLREADFKLESRRRKNNTTIIHCEAN